MQNNLLVVISNIMSSNFYTDMFSDYGSPEHIDTKKLFTVSHVRSTGVARGGQGGPHAPLIRELPKNKVKRGESRDWSMPLHITYP